MHQVKTISTTDLARRTRQVVDRVRRGNTLIVESYGEEQVVVVDILDYRILRGLVAYHSLGSHPAPVYDATREPTGLTETQIEEAVKESGDAAQARWNRVMIAYLDGHINLGRAADLLGLSRFELDERFRRLDVLRRIGPETVEEAQAEIAAARASSSQ